MNDVKLASARLRPGSGWGGERAPGLPEEGEKELANSLLRTVRAAQSGRGHKKAEGAVTPMNNVEDVRS